jgi:hypothetical protein
MITIQEKVKSMGKKMSEMRDSTSDHRKSKCFGLLSDAVVHTSGRIDLLSPDSLVGFIQLASVTVVSPDMEFGFVYNFLKELGFSTSAAN